MKTTPPLSLSIPSNLCVSTRDKFLTSLSSLGAYQHTLLRRERIDYSRAETAEAKRPVSGRRDCKIKNEELKTKIAESYQLASH